MQGSLNEKFTMINIGQGYRKIKIDDINYINIERRNLCFHTINNENIMSCCLRQSFSNETKYLMKFNELYLIGNTLIVNCLVYFLTWKIFNSLSSASTSLSHNGAIITLK